jgi:hypothetical protein
MGVAFVALSQLNPHPKPPPVWGGDINLSYSPANKSAKTLVVA